MRKKMANDKVIKAMAVGLSAVISLSTPMTAMAAEGDVDNTPVPTDDCDTKNESNQTAESAIQEAKESTPVAAEAAQAEVLENVEAEVKKEDTTETVTYENVAENEQAAKESLVNAEVDLIQKDASEQAADVAVNKADGIVKEIETNIDEIEVANGAAKEAVEAADEAAKKANSATTAAEVNAAIEEIEAAQAKLEEQQAAAQASYDENVEKLAAAEAELKAAEKALAAAEASLNASKEDIAKAQAAVDEAAKEAEALKKAVDDEATNLENTKAAALKTAYDNMIAQGNLITKLYDGEASKGDGIGDEFVDSFGKETAKGTKDNNRAYWDAAAHYFELYLQYIYGDAYSEGSWDKTNRYYLDEEDVKKHAERDNTFTVTYFVLDENGEKIKDEKGEYVTKTALYNYHTDSSYLTDNSKKKGDICIYEKKVCYDKVQEPYDVTKPVDTLSIKTETTDGNGNTVVTYVKYDDVKTDNDVKVSLKDSEGNETGSVLVKNDQSTTTADVNDLDNYKKTLESNQEVTKTENAETTYSVGTVTVIDSYEQKSVLDQSYTDFDNKKDIENVVSAAIENGQTVRVKWDGIFADYDMEVKDANSFVMFVDKLAGIIGKGIVIDTYKEVDDTTKPITHEEDGIIETTTADVTVKKVETMIGDTVDHTWAWYGITTTSKENADKEAKKIVDEMNAADPSKEATYKVVSRGWGYYGYEIYYNTYTTTTQTVSTKSYTAVKYDINAIDVTTTHYKDVTLDWLEERKNTENDATVMAAIANYERELLELQNKQDAAAIALAAAQQAQKDVEEAAKALASENMNVDRTSYEAALAKYNLALADHEKSLDKLGDINDAVIKAQEDLEDAEEELARFIPIPDDDDDNDDEDDYAGPVVPVAPAAVIDIAPAAVPLAAAPVVGGGAVVDGAEDDADDNEGVVIEDGETPLAGSIEDVVDSEEKIIEDEETPLAAAPVEKMSWWWLLVVALFGATGYEMYRKHQAKKAEADKEK